MNQPKGYQETLTILRLASNKNYNFKNKQYKRIYAELMTKLPREIKQIGSETFIECLKYWTKRGRPLQTIFTDLGDL